MNQYSNMKDYGQHTKMLFREHQKNYKYLWIKIISYLFDSELKIDFSLGKGWKKYLYLNVWHTLI